MKRRSHAPRLLIVHGDDFGISEPVNRGIAEAYSSGILRSASIMAVGRAFDHAVETCRQHPALDIGVHLTLIEERPLSDANRVLSLIGENGRFHDSAMKFVGRYFRRGIDPDEVRRELDAQIARVRDAGLAISHLDSHQHIHMLPGVFRIVLELAARHSIGAVRIPRERISAGAALRSFSPMRSAQQAVLNHFCRHSARRNATLHSDHFAGFYFGGRMNTANLLWTLRRLPESGSVEIMCHPSQADPSGEYDHWQYRGEDELKALTEPAVLEFVESIGVKLCSYTDLTAS